MRRVHINIGSNTGDRRAHIERAVAAVFELDEGEGRCSGWVESEPWGFGSEHRFLNVGVEIWSTLEPEELLERLLCIERRLCGDPHRNADGSYRDRGLDIDLIVMGLEERHTERLELPHPRMWGRPFVMGPLRELWPEWEALWEGRKSGG